MPGTFQRTSIAFCLPALCLPTLCLIALFSAAQPQLRAQEPADPNAPAVEGTECTGGWRLADSTSLYLREHAENPVEWYPWGEEAFERARTLDRPIFLSIGYSSCHWCHVMRRESFSDDEIAAVLNEKFVAIKVDREDLPHVDAAYMDAVQAMTGRGGWPLSVFLMPDGKPFFGATYFPPRSGPRGPGFLEILGRIDEVWRGERARVEETGTALRELLVTNAAESGEAIERRAYLDRGLVQARERFDSRNGGWRVAPKFPDPRLCEFLIATTALGGDRVAREMAERTLEAMAAGGVHDQIAGGFHRYAVDAEWVVPHFEKMLYSQGLLAEAYLLSARIDGNARAAAIARRTLDAMLRDFRLDDGTFAGSFDADSGDEEGTYYVWTPAQVDALFPDEQTAALVKAALGITDAGNFEGERTVLTRPVALEELAKSHTTGVAQVEKTLAAAFETMRIERAKRVAPKRDPKVILGWNALAVSALAHGAIVLKDHRYRTAAEEALATLRAKLVTKEGRFLRRVSGDEAAHPATLADAALYLKAVLDLYEATFDPKLIAHAREVESWIARDFAPDVAAGEAAGMYFDAPRSEAERVHRWAPRTRESIGGAIPSGNGTHVRNLLRLHALTAEARLLDTADAILADALARSAQFPLAGPELLLAALVRETGMPEIVIAGDLRNPRTRTLLDPALAAPMPFRMVVTRPVGEADSEAVKSAVAAIPILEGRDPIEGRPTAWFCVDFVCREPSRSGAALQEVIDGWLAEKKAAGQGSAASEGSATEESNEE